LSFLFHAGCFLHPTAFFLIPLFFSILSRVRNLRISQTSSFCATSLIVPTILVTVPPGSPISPAQYYSSNVQVFQNVFLDSRRIFSIGATLIRHTRRATCSWMVALFFLFFAFLHSFPPFLFYAFLTFTFSVSVFFSFSFLVFLALFFLFFSLVFLFFYFFMRIFLLFFSLSFFRAQCRFPDVFGNLRRHEFGFEDSMVSKIYWIMGYAYCRDNPSPSGELSLTRLKPYPTHIFASIVRFFRLHEVSDQ